MAGLQDEPYHIAVEIVNKRCKVSMKLEELGIRRFKVIDVRGLTGGLTRHLVKMPSKQIEKIPQDMFVKAQIDGRFREETSAWFDSDGCDVCSTILSNGSFLISGRDIEDYNFIYTFITPSFDAFKTIISSLEEEGLKPKVLKIEK